MVGSADCACACACAQAAGACAISSVGPGAYGWLGEAAPDLERSVAFFRAVASTGQLPFYPYWLGSLCSGPTAARDFLCAMLEVPHFAGLKYTSGDLYTFEQLIALAPSMLGRPLNLLSGCDEVRTPSRAPWHARSFACIPAHTMA